MENWWFNTEFKVSFKRTTSPCLKCDDRHERCHAECDRYKTWKGEDMFKAEQRRSAKMSEQTDYRSDIQTIQKMNRIRKGKPK